MASNQDRLFIANPVIPDSSRLRYAQACGFNLDVFNAAAKADRNLINAITYLGLFLNRVNSNQNELDKELSVKPLLERAKDNFRLTAPRKIRPQRSPNAPNTAPAFSLVAA
jgi:hypothetical protein